MAAENVVSDMPAIDTVATSIDTQSSPGFFQKTVRDFSFDSVLEKLHLSRENLLEIALYFGGGFVCGFFFKKYNHYFLVMAFFMVILLIADYGNIISLTINTETIKSILGCPPLPEQATLLSCLVAMVQEHVRASVSFISGFIIGLWIG